MTTLLAKLQLAQCAADEKEATKGSDALRPCYIDVLVDAIATKVNTALASDFRCVPGSRTAKLRFTLEPLVAQNMWYTAASRRSMTPQGRVVLQRLHDRGVREVSAVYLFKTDDDSVGVELEFKWS